MKLKNVRKENEMVIRVSFGAKESLDDKLEMYLRYIEKNQGIKLKKGDMVEMIVEQFVAEDKQFKRWMNDNGELLNQVRDDRRNALERKKRRRNARNEDQKPEGQNGESKPSEKGDNNVAEFRQGSQPEKVADRRSETPMSAPSASKPSKEESDSQVVM